ncbi:MAG: hypothetical protein IT442_05480 [Phycisphaeraceae bacterium]|nr:hypothetical protein [Phycisphaeraceae bacterium]
MRPIHDNLRAGLFVLGGVALAMAVIFALSDVGAFFQRTRALRVSYKLSDGLRGLKEGAVVSLGDTPIGEVTAIEDAFEAPGEGGDGRVVGKIVSAEIPRRYRLHRNARVELVVPTLGSGTKLNITSVGDGELYKGPEPIPGALAGSQLTDNLMRDAGIQDQQRHEIQQIIANLQQITQTLREDLPTLTASARKILGETEPLSADARESVAELKASLSRINELVGQVQGHSGPWFERIDKITASTTSLTGRMDQLLTDKDQALRQTIDQIHDLSAKAAAAAEDARAVVAEMRTLAASSRPGMERVMANLQLTGDQLKLAAIEVRRSPWRLLYSPSKKELETDNLYDAARSFALAASTLEGSLASLKEVTADTPEDRARIEQMNAYLDKLYGRFQEAEQAFWRELEGVRSAQKKR